MTLSDATERALERRAREGGVGVEVVSGAERADARVTDLDRIGVKVGRIAVRKADKVDLEREVEELPGRLRSLPERLAPVEVDAAHGRAVLRTDPDEMRRREFFELQVQGARELEIRRFRISADGDRERIDWTMTREQFGRLLDELAKAPKDPDVGG